MKRRTFLASAGAAIVGCAAPAALPSPSPITPPATTAPIATRAASPSPTGPPDWEALRGRLRGALVRPADAAYDATRVLYNTRFDGLRPQAVARCASVADVQACIAFARRYGVAISPRSGGHSYGGWSSGTGLVVDVSGLSSIDIPGETAVIGAGARLADVYAAVGARGVGIPAGSCPTVGIAGLTLGGGLGVLSRGWGLTSDNVVRAEIITPDGSVRTCDEEHDADLFWALRGGGGGNFGIVTSLTLRTRPALPLAIAFLTWPWAQAAAVLRAWQTWLGSIPSAVWSNVHLDGGSGIEPTLLVHAVGIESVDALQTHLDALVNAIGRAPGSRTVFMRPYAEAMMLEGGCAQLDLAQCHLKGTTPSAQLERETYAAKSSIAKGLLSDPAIATIIAGLEDLQATPAAGAGSVLIDAMGAAIAGPTQDATAFRHRGGHTVLQFISSWDTSASPATANASLAWLRAFYGRARPLIGPSAYVNYADPDLADWQTAYYGDNYPRLQQVRAKYDPEGLFDFPQAIR